MIFLAGILSVLGVFTASAYVIGKFNQLVTLRHQISTGMLQLDFALRNQSAELRVLECRAPWHKQKGLPPTDFSSRLDRAEEVAHKAVSGWLCDGNLAHLAVARELIDSVWKAVLTDGGDDCSRLAHCRLASNAEAWGEISRLVAHYRLRIRKFPCRWVAFFSGFEELGTTETSGSP